MRTEIWLLNKKGRPPPLHEIPFVFKRLLMWKSKFHFPCYHTASASVYYLVPKYSRTFSHFTSFRWLANGDCLLLLFLLPETDEIGERNQIRWNDMRGIRTHTLITTKTMCNVLSSLKIEHKKRENTRGTKMRRYSAKERNSQPTSKNAWTLHPICQFCGEIESFWYHLVYWI